MSTDSIDLEALSWVCYDGPSPLRTFELCGLDSSYWSYRPRYGTNVAFAVIFAISLAAFLIQGLLVRKWWAFTLAMTSGCVLELIGYIGRAKAYDHLWDESFFLVQIICLTIGPAFLAAGIYFCLSRIVTTVGSENSRIKPRSYPFLFILCDLLSLVLQATGGGMASVATHQHQSADTGNTIMIAGLAFQVFTLLLFMLLALDFAICTYRRISRLGAQSALDQRHEKLRASWVFRGFLVALAVSTLCIFARCVYRVVELSDGWSGRLMRTQKYFIGLEGAVVVAAVLLLNVFHPALCLREAVEPTAVQGRGRNWYGKKKFRVRSGDADIELREMDPRG